MLRNYSLIALVSIGFSSAGFAKGDGAHPCKELRASCEAAGFYKGGHKDNNKGLWKDCMGPIMEGKSVNGVNVDATKVAACKAKKSEHKQHQD